MHRPLFVADPQHTMRCTHDQLRNARIFITGGTGFFSKWILESLLCANDILKSNCQATESSAKLNAGTPLLMLDTLAEATHTILDFAKSCGTQDLLLTSSGAVYGSQFCDTAA